MQIATLCFLLRGDEICLGMKKIGFGAGKWNGFGGKVGDREEIKNETIEEAAKRETKEESGVVVKKIEKVAEIQFDFPHKPEWGQIVHVFVCWNWEGEPHDSKDGEMHPQWFKRSEIPYDIMWPDDKIWLPLVLEGKRIRGYFVFDEKEEIALQEMAIVDEIHPPHNKEVAY